MKMLIIGGGITGLAAAWEGVQRGADVILVEAATKLGGKLVTDRVDGLVIERGPDSFVSYRPGALQLAKEVGIEDQVIAAQGVRKVSLNARGKLRPMPDDMGMLLPTRIMPFATTRVLTWGDKIRAGMDLALPRQLPDHDVSIGSLIRKRLGEGVVRRFANPLVGGIYGATVDELSLDAVMPSLRVNENDHRSLILASLAAGKAKKPGGAGSVFRSFRDGLATLPEAVVAKLSDARAELITGRMVSRVRYTETGTVATLNDGREIKADVVIFAGGVSSSKELLTPDFPTAADALGNIPLASTRLVTLAWPQAQLPPTDQHGWLEADAAPISGVTISSAKWENRAPQETVLLRAFVPDRVGAAATLGDDALLDTVVAHVRPLLGANSDPSRAEITRWNGVMPKYTVGHLDRVATVESDLATRPSWRVAGSALHGVGIPECISDGRKQAALALEGVQ